MQDVLAAIQKANYATNPPALLHAFFHLGTRHGVTGDYVIYPDGNTSQTTFDGYGVGPSGRLRFRTRIAVG
jgi:hypothetical protein